MVILRALLALFSCLTLTLNARAAVPDQDGVPGVESLPPGARAILEDAHGQGTVFAVAFSPDGKSVVTTGQDGSLRVWHLESGKESRRFLGHERAIHAAAFSPDGKSLASGGEDKMIRVWNVASGRELHRLTGHRKSIEAIAFSPDGRTLASASRDGTVRLWDVMAGQEVCRLPEQPHLITCVAFSPDGRVLASGGYDRMVRLWDVASTKLLGPPRGHYGRVHYLAFSADGKHLMSGGLDQLIHVWTVAPGPRICELGGYEGPVAAIAVSRDGKTIISGNEDRGVHLWETLTGKERARFEGHASRVTAVALSPDGRTVVSASAEGMVLVWDLARYVRSRPPEGDALKTQNLESLWDDLAGGDAPRAYRAVWLLSSEPQQSLPFLKERLEQVLTMTFQVPRLIGNLDNPQYRVRQAASRELEKSGELVVPLLRRALKAKPPLEVQQRLELTLEKLERDQEAGTFSARVRILRAIEVLERIGTSDARHLLEKIAKGPLEAPLVQETKAALDRLDRLAVTHP